MITTQEQLSYDQIISLLSICQSDYEHRDRMLWSHTFTFFYVSIFFMIIPSLAEHFSVNLHEMSPDLFCQMGMLISTIAYLFSLSHQKRLEASTETFKKLNDYLPKNYRRVTVDELEYGKFFKGRQAIIIPLLLYLISLAIGITLIMAQKA